MKKSIKNLICVASMAAVIAASFCAVSADTASYNLYNSGVKPVVFQKNYFRNVNAVAGETPSCAYAAIGVDIVIKSGSTTIGTIRPRRNESTKSYIQSINNCSTETTLVCTGGGTGSCSGRITTS